MRVDAKTNELKAALEMLAILPIKGRLITADAIQTHRAILPAVIAGGGDYILPVKDNQPTLRADLEAAFAEPEAGLSPSRASAVPPAWIGPRPWTRGMVGSRSGRWS